jgi:hypothetical protein
VGGGAGGDVSGLVDAGLVEAGLVVRSDVDGKTNELVSEVVSLYSLIAVAGRYLPLGSRRVGFASVADVVLTMRRSAKHSARWNGRRIVFRPRTGVPR